LSALDGAELHRAIVAQDKAMVSRANGVGPKLAERIVRELKDKTGSIGRRAEYRRCGGRGWYGGGGPGRRHRRGCDQRAHRPRFQAL
jgi:hypothetical protein